MMTPGRVRGVSATGPTRHHATAFLDPRDSGPVEELRSRWDPLMAQLIAAHVTLIYSEEIPDPAQLEQLAAIAAASTPPFTIALGPAFYVGSPADGVFFHVHDPEGGIGSFRARTVPAGQVIDFPPHVTIVHPRTSRLGEQAWNDLATARVAARFILTQVAVTASSGDRWQTLRLLPLTGEAP
jgi:2'-5' RNA ligase